MSGLPDLHHAVPARARASRTGDPAKIASAARDLAAAKIAHAIDKTLLASGVPLKSEHADELAAKLKAAAR